jgi:LysW-gamma-L-lysine carboxypeptidase
MCEKIIGKVIDNFQVENPNVSVASMVLDKVEPFVADRTTLLAKALEKAIVEVTGGPSKFLKKTGTGDMNIFGTETRVLSITYGPGDSRLSHTKNERIELSEYIACIQVYKRTIENLLT